MKDFFKFIIETLIASYWGGIAMIILGIAMIIYQIKNPQTNKFSPLQGDFKGWAAGIGGIIMGLLIIIYKILGKI